MVGVVFLTLFACLSTTVVRVLGALSWNWCSFRNQSGIGRFTAPVRKSPNTNRVMMFDWSLAVIPSSTLALCPAYRGAARIEEIVRCDVAATLCSPTAWRMDLRPCRALISTGTFVPGLFSNVSDFPDFSAFLMSLCSPKSGSIVVPQCGPTFVITRAALLVFSLVPFLIIQLGIRDVAVWGLGHVTGGVMRCFCALFAQTSDCAQAARALSFRISRRREKWSRLLIDGIHAHLLAFLAAAARDRLVRVVRGIGPYHFCSLLASPDC